MTSTRNVPHPRPARGSQVCHVCGRRVRIFIPAGGDGSLDIFTRHMDGEEVCLGSRQPAPRDDDLEPQVEKRTKAGPGRFDRSDRRHGRGRNVAQGLPTRSRVPGTNGTWPSHSAEEARPPRPPAICNIVPDLAEEDLPIAIYGQYPKALIGKLLPWLRCDRREIVHVCSGSLHPGEGIRVDLRREARPDILADGRRLPFADGSVAAVLLDPPYTQQYARDLYGTDYPRPRHLLAEAARVVRPSGRIGFVHYLVPSPPKGCQIVRVFGLSTGFGFPMRAVTLYEREQGGLF